MRPLWPMGLKRARNGCGPPRSPDVGGGPAAPGGRRQHGRLRRGQESWRRRRCLRQLLAPGYGPVAGYPGREYPRAGWWCRICQRADRSLVSPPHVVRLSGSLMATASRPRQLPLVGCAPERSHPRQSPRRPSRSSAAAAPNTHLGSQDPRTALPWGGRPRLLPMVRHWGSGPRPLANDRRQHRQGPGADHRTSAPGPLLQRPGTLPVAADSGTGKRELFS